MKTKLLGVLLAPSLTAPALALAAITEMPVSYKVGETSLKGFVVVDAAKKAKRPGIIVVHEWWGITQHTHNEARLGYDEKVTKEAEAQATKFFTEVFKR